MTVTLSYWSKGEAMSSLAVSSQACHQAPSKGAGEIVGNLSSGVLMPVLQCGQHSAFSRSRQFSAHVSSRLMLLNFICTGLCYWVQCPCESPRAWPGQALCKDAFCVSSPSHGAPLSCLDPRLQPSPSYCVVLKQVTSLYLSRSNPGNNTSQIRRVFFKPFELLRMDCTMEMHPRCGLGTGAATMWLGNLRWCFITLCLDWMQGCTKRWESPLHPTPP